MQVPLSSQIRPTAASSLRRMEKPTDYIGPLPTTGRGVGIAVIDSGVFPHPDLDANLTAAVSFYSESHPDQDAWGHGTSTAGVIVGNGASSDGEITGVAPGAKVINLQVLTKQKSDNPTEAIAAMRSALDWTVDHRDQFNIKVINISGALAPIRNDHADPALVRASGGVAISIPDGQGQIATFLDPLDASIRRAVEAGIVVVCAAGNDGPQAGSVWGTPNYRSDVITVGSLDTNGTPAQIEDDFIAEHSARGPTITQMVKPDLVAPGVGILTPAAPHSEIVTDRIQSAARIEGYRSLPDSGLLEALTRAVFEKQLPSKVFAEALPELSRLLPESHRALLNRVPAAAQTAMAMKLLSASIDKDQLSTETDAYQQAVTKLREGLERLAPKPTLGELAQGGPAYLAQDGTSFAAPIVSGIVAHMFEVNPNLTPDQVKTVLMETARPVPGADPFSAGAGALNAQAAIDRARQLASEAP